MERGLKIKYDVATGVWSFEAVGVGWDGQFEDHARDAKEEYGNALFNGKMEVQYASGKTAVFEDGLHLVQRDASLNNALQVMSKTDYETWTGRPGSANED